MQFTTVAVAAMSVAGALAQTVKVHVVRVSSANGTLAYSPNNLKADVGDMVQFQFAPMNHTVTQSTFDQPCQPIAMNSNVTEGVFSGFMLTTAASATTPVYTIQINNTTPMWLYCSQGKHCQNGMTMVINENTAANATRSLANYQALAKTSTVNLAPGQTLNGTAASSSSSSGSGSGTSSSGSAQSSSAGTQTTSYASSIKAPATYAVLALAGLVFLF